MDRNKYCEEKLLNKAHDGSLNKVETLEYLRGELKDSFKEAEGINQEVLHNSVLLDKYIVEYMKNYNS